MVLSSYRSFADVSIYSWELWFTIYILNSNNRDIFLYRKYGQENITLVTVTILNYLLQTFSKVSCQCS